jgi:subtilase family serine protease
MRFLLTICLLTMLIAPAKAETVVSSHPLITQTIDERQTVTLEGNTRPEVAKGVGQAVPDDMPMTHIQLLLRRSPERETALEIYVDGLTKRGSPNYHKWLTATEFGLRFGLGGADVTRVTRWLLSKGLRVNFVYPNRMMIDFSGSAGQVSAAFKTQIHRLTSGGEAHIANVGDPRIPAALAPAIEGIVSLHDFRAHSGMHARPAVTATCNKTCTAVGPGDMATIYDLKRLFDNGYAGQGQVIATVEYSNLYKTSDWSTFRRAFGLDGHSTGRLMEVHPAPAGGGPCGNPGVNSGNDGEAALDTEWASAAAPGATIMLVSCASTSNTDGVFLGVQNLVNSAKPPSIINVSWATCEVYNGAAANAAYNRVYQQAAAEGISVFVASGDSGASGCAPGPDATPSGIGVNGLGDSAYSVSVGGTDFRDTFDGTTSSYWGPDTGAPWSTAKSYIPEIPWNDNCASLFIAEYYGTTNVTYGAGGFCNSNSSSSFHTLSAGGGGPSRCYSGRATVGGVVSGSCRGYPKPSWQQGFVGDPADGVRDTPDVSLFASDGAAWGHAYATCYTDPNGGGGPCTGNPRFWAGDSGGTSYGSPIMAGIQALVNQYKGGAQGNPLRVYYNLAAQQYGSSGNPNCSANRGAGIGSACVFHDIVSGDIDIYCVGGYSCYQPSGYYGVLSGLRTRYFPAYDARKGYDLATGIGSVDAYNLVVRWP